MVGICGEEEVGLGFGCWDEMVGVLGVVLPDCDTFVWWGYADFLVSLSFAHYQWCLSIH